FDTVGDAWFFNKRGSTGATAEYQFRYYLGNLSLQIWNTDGTQISWTIPQSFTVGQWVHLSGFTDISTNSISIFRNSVLLGGTITGTFKAIQTTSQDLVIGR